MILPVGILRMILSFLFVEVSTSAMNHRTQWSLARLRRSRITKGAWIMSVTFEKSSRVPEGGANRFEQQVDGPGDLTERYQHADPDEQLSLWLQRPDVRGELDSLEPASATTPARRKGWLGRLLRPRNS